MNIYEYSAIRLTQSLYEKESGLNRNELDVTAAIFSLHSAGVLEIMKSPILFDMTQSTMYRTIKTLLAKQAIEKVGHGCKYQVVV